MSPKSRGKKVVRKREKSWREKITQRFYYAKFLKLFLYNKWFAFFSILIALICLSVAVVIPKFYRVTPVHMDEVEKRSLLDFIQARQLHKTAQKFAEKGDIDDATSAWAQAIQQNPGNKVFVRNFVSFLVDNDSGSQYVGQAVNFGQWLLKLDQTNSTDAILMSRVYNKYGFPTESLKLLEPIQDQSNESIKAEYVKALFENQKLEDFITNYHLLSEESQALPNIKPIYLAYQSSYEKDTQLANNAFKDLQALVAKEPTNDFLVRLIFLASLIREDTELIQKALDQLAGINAARPQHHHALWRVLANNGKEDEARKLAQLYPHPPYTASGLVSQYETLHELGLASKADRYAENHIQQFGYTPAPWFVICNSLMDRGKWKKLGEFANLMLVDPRMAKYVSYAHYFVGKSQVGQFKYGSATDSFKQISAAGLGKEDSALRVIRDLTVMGYPILVVNLVEKILEVEKWRENKDMLRLLFQAGWNIRDLKVCLSSSFRLYQLDPTNITDAFNYAGCLIAERQRPKEALIRTQDLLSKTSNSLPAQINHALALLMNNDLVEADKILNIQINETTLPASFKPSYYAALFELNVKLKNSSQARLAFSKIEMDDLYTEEKLWLNNQFKRLGDQ